jgi:hypothetical protein
MENHHWRYSRSHGRRRCDQLQSYSPVHPYQYDVTMHELSIALNIVQIAEQELARSGGERVVAVHLQVGSLAGVAKEALLFSFGFACEGTAVEGSDLIIEDTDGQTLEVVRMEIEP